MLQLSSARAPNTKKPTSAKPMLETLEERANPSNYLDASGNLVIIGRDVADTVTVTYTPPSQIYLVGKIKVTENGVTTAYNYGRVWSGVTGKIIFRGNDGDDYFNNYVNSLDVEAYGMAGNDTLIGDGGNDKLVGDIGNDYLAGWGGNDTMEGGQGYDQLFGGAGNDDLDGTDDLDNDYLVGGPDMDVFQQDLRGSYNADAPRDFQPGVDYYINEYQNGGW